MTEIILPVLVRFFHLGSKSYFSVPPVTAAIVRARVSVVSIKSMSMVF